MITSAIIPRPLARLPWRLIFLVATIAGFGLLVLYSAAGGSAQPWAVKQAIIFIVFLGIAIAMSWVERIDHQGAHLPALRRHVAHADRGRGAGLRQQGRAALARARPDPPAAVGIHEAGDRPHPRPFLRTGPGRRNSQMARDLARAAAARRPRLPDPRPARPRHLHHGRAVRRDGDVPRRAAVVDLRRARGRGRGGRADRLQSAPRLSAQADRRLPRSRRAIRSAPATTSASRRSRSARAEFGARASSRAARAISITSPRAIPISCSRPWPRNGAWSAGSS